MRLAKTTFSPLRRSFAAAALVVWVVAQAFCFAHCNFGVSHGDSESASCLGPAPSQAHHEGGGSCCPTQGDKQGGIVCTSLKSALTGSGSTALVQPDLHLLYELAPFALALDAMATKPAGLCFRQAQPRDWVFTPEVCLGPAHRSHAPPFLS